MIIFLRRFAELMYRLAPKWNHAVIWGWPDYEDSVIALEQELQKSRVRKVVLLMSDPDRPPTWEMGRKTIRVKKNSVSGWLWFCLAKYVFFTHPCFTRNFPPNVVSVNVWHGMPIKKIGWLIENDPGTSASFTLATSPFWAEIMERVMRPHGQVLSSGLPRNDRLFSRPDEVFRKLGLNADQRLLTWLPTYRKSVRGLPRTDGIDSGNVFEMPDVNPEELNTFLESRNAVLLVKPHPMAAFDQSQSWSNLFIVDDQWLRDRSLSLYQTLGASDVLISDISSVVIDYLLLDRPIIHAFPDLGVYRSSRGFTVEPIEEYFAGAVATNQAEFHAALDLELTGCDPNAAKRRKLRDLSHSHKDANATEKLLKAIGLPRRGDVEY